MYIHTLQCMHNGQRKLLLTCTGSKTRMGVKILTAFPISARQSIIILILHLSVHAWEREVTGSHSTRTKKRPFLWIARVGLYTKEPTDTTSNGTSPWLKEALCNSAGQKFDWEVSLHVAAWRRWTSAIWESRLFMDAWQREMILF